MLSLVPLFATPWILPCLAPLSIEFSRQEYQSGLPVPFPQDLPDPGIKPASPALQADSLPLNYSGSPTVGIFIPLANTPTRSVSPQLESWLLEQPWTARRSNQWILKEINLEYSLEGLMLKLKLQYFGHQMQSAKSLEKILMLGKAEGRRRRRWQKMKRLDGIINSMDMSLSKLQKIVKDREAWHGTVHEISKSQTQLSKWTTTTKVMGM